MCVWHTRLGCLPIVAEKPLGAPRNSELPPPQAGEQGACSARPLAFLSRSLGTMFPCRG